MPAMNERMGVDLSKYTPATPVPSQQSIGIPSSDLQPGYNVFQRCPIPPVWQSSPDALRQFYTGAKVPQVRLFNTSV